MHVGLLSTRLVHAERGALIAALVSLAVVLAAWFPAKLPPSNEYDQPFYLSVAGDFMKTGRFTNGMWEKAAPWPDRPSGMMFGPVYPGLIIATSLIDRSALSVLECVARTSGNTADCPRSLRLLRTMQAVMLAAVFFLVFWTTREALADPLAAWIALTLALLCVTALVRYSIYAMTEMTTLLLATAAIACTTAAFRRDSLPWLAGAAFLAGLLALTRPAYWYIIPAVLAFGLVRCAWSLRSPRALAYTSVFAAVASVPIAAWVARNTAVLATPAISAGYSTVILAQRVAFNEMSSNELVAAIPCWLPGGLGPTHLVAPGICNRLVWKSAAGEPDTFIQHGNRTVYHETLAAAGDPSQHLRQLIVKGILLQPVKHALVSIALTVRGATLNHYWGLALGICCLLVTWRAWRQDDRVLQAILLPAWFMLLFHSFVAVNHVRYNLFLLLPYALAGAVLLVPHVRRWLGVMQPYDRQVAN